LIFFHASGRIVLAPSQFDGDLHHFAQHLAHAVAAVGPVGAGLHHLFDMRCLQTDGALVAVGLAFPIHLAAEPISNVAVDTLRDRLEWP